MKKVQDHYFQKARREGFAARSVYKLEEIDRRRRLLRRGMRVLDLGSAPGSWLQYAARAVGAEGAVVGVDLQPVNVRLPGNAVVIQGDIFEMEPATLIATLMGQPADGGAEQQGTEQQRIEQQATASRARGGLYDLMLSDMAPRTTGIPSADAARSAELVLRALELSAALLRPGGALLAKVFQGAALPELRRAFGQAFEKVSLEKPKASRAESVEVFLLGSGRKP